MKNAVKTIGLSAWALAVIGTAWAQDTVAGKWQGQFDSQIGLQKYTFDFKVDGTNLTGRATAERQRGTNTVALTEGTVRTNEITFVEPLKFGDNDVRIVYTGKVSGDEIKFHRKVGEIAEEDFVARRVNSPGTGSEAKPAKP